MRPKFAAFLCCFAIAASAVAPSLAGGEAAFPYKAYITSDDVHVRSGPGMNYYATDTLKQGQTVEVYRHEPGGWCAIRPPEGSFSWISTHFLKPTHDRLAVVTEEGAAARIGSKFRDTRDVLLRAAAQGRSGGSARSSTRRRRRRSEQLVYKFCRQPVNFAGCRASFSTETTLASGFAIGTIAADRRPKSRFPPNRAGLATFRPKISKTNCSASI